MDSQKPKFIPIPAHPQLNRSVVAKPGSGSHTLSAAPEPLVKNAFNPKTKMGALALDTQVRRELKQNTAATLIQRAFRNRKKSGGAKQAARQFVNQELPKVTPRMQQRVDFNSATLRMEKGAYWKKHGINPQPDSTTMVRHQSQLGTNRDLKELEPSGGLDPLEKRFLQNVRSVTPHVRATFYFNKEHESAILKGGHLLSHQQRENRFGKGNAPNKTGDLNADELGNNDHVFFFLEHRDEAFKRTRFTQPSTATGKAKVPLGDSTTGDERRIRVPLSHLMKPGTWAMPRDFLGPDPTDKKYSNMTKIQDRHNFVDGGQSTNPDHRAETLMMGLGLKAIRRMRTMDRATRASMLQTEGKRLMSVLNRHVLSPQLQVPGGVSLHTPGMTLERAPKGQAFSIREQHGMVAKL